VNRQQYGWQAEHEAVLGLFLITVAYLLSAPAFLGNMVMAKTWGFNRAFFSGAGFWCFLKANSDPIRSDPIRSDPIRSESGVSLPP
jgi:hypothetical protein